MIILDNIRNIEPVQYTNLGNKCPITVQQKIQFDSFINCGCAVVTIGGEKHEAYRIFHYNYRKYNDRDTFYSVFEFKRSRKKEYVLRIVAWDRIRNAEKSHKDEGADVYIESNVYYLSGEHAQMLKKGLNELSQKFSEDNKYTHKYTDYLEQEVFLDIDGVEKVFRWRAPFFNESVQAVLKKTVSCISKSINDLEQNISSVEFVFENCSAIHKAYTQHK